MANYKLLIPLLRKNEGGLSNAKTDPARVDPVPDGTGNHTNNGVTWGTFKWAAPRLGYTATPALFYEMPKWVWEGIYKKLFWDKLRGDEIKSQGIADMLVDFAYNAGVGAAIKLAQYVLLGMHSGTGQVGPKTLDALNHKDYKKTLDKLYNGRLAFYKSLTTLWPIYAVGWTNRLNSVYDFAKKNIGTVAVAGGGLLFGGIGLFFLIRYWNSDNDKTATK